MTIFYIIFEVCLCKLKALAEVGGEGWMYNVVREYVRTATNIEIIFNFWP